MIVAAQWLRIWVFGMDTLVSNASKLFWTNFMYFFYPAMTVLLEYFDPVIYSCLAFAL